MSDRAWSLTRVTHVAPVLAIAAGGAVWIVAHASHDSVIRVIFQGVALGESVVALLLRRRKPLASLIGILVAYAFVDLDVVLLPGVLLALATVARHRESRAAALATAAAAGTTVWVASAGVRPPAGLAGSIPARASSPSPWPPARECWRAGRVRLRARR